MEDRTALVGYATETGNAYAYAEELACLLERIHFTTQLSSLDAIEASSLGKHTFVIIVVSTTGQGDFPLNARSFWKALLRKKLPPTFLNGVRLSVFGLGDSSYPKFNWAARKLHKRLLQLGANEIYPRGEADEQHDEGLDAAFVPWSSDLCQVLLTKFPLPPSIEPIPQTELLKPKWRLTLDENATKRDDSYRSNGNRENQIPENTIPRHSESVRNPSHTSIAHDDSQKFAVTLKKNHRMTPDEHWQDVRHMEFVSKSKAAYGPGDILTIQPKNSADDAHQLIERMGWTDIADRAVYFTHTRATNKGNVPSMLPIALSETITTIRKLLIDHLDITAIPRRSFFSLIAHFTDDQFHKDRLLEFTDPKYIDELYDYTTRPRRSILEVLQEFDSVKIPWYWVASVIPELRGRQFSIASGGILKQASECEARFELLVTIVRYKTVIKKVREGVCSRYLAALPAGAELEVGLQKGSLAVQKDGYRRPVVMVGPGTGVAPMRSLIWERFQRFQEVSGSTYAKLHGKEDGVYSTETDLLFFGCRSESADYFYRDEWQDLMGKMPLKVHTAFSRDQHQKIYVQDLIRQQSKSVYASIHEANGLVYVCGSSGKMPTAVRSALVDVFVKHGNMDHGSAGQYLEAMEREGRYKQETW